MNTNVNIPVYYFKTVESTNKMAREYLKTKRVNKSTVILADHQSQGRGQIDNEWESQAGMNLLMSYIFFPSDFPAENQFTLNMAVSLACHQALSGHADGFKIKWPNDLFHDGKKVGGILMENSLSGSGITSCIAGIGINLNQVQFREYVPTAVSLSRITGLPIKPRAFMDILLEKLTRMLVPGVLSDHEALKRRYLENLLFFDQTVVYQDYSRSFKGKIVDIAPGGEVKIKDSNGHVESYGFKEVRLKEY